MLGCSSETDSIGHVIYTADAYARDGRRFTVLSEEKLSAFLELERVTGVPLGEKDWEIIADNLKKAGWSLGWVSTLDREGRTIWIADAHRGYGKQFVVRADEKLAALGVVGSSIG